MMFEPGTQIQAWCEFCEKLGPATFAFGQALVDGRTVKNILRATCDQCGQVVAIAPDATPAIAEALKKPPTGRTRTTIRISKELRGAVSAKLVEIGAPPNDFDLIVNAFVIHYAYDATNKRALQKHLSQLDAPLLRQAADTTITLRLKLKAWQVLEDVEDEANLGTSQLIRRILFWFAAEATARARERSAREETPLVREARRLALVS